MSAYVGAPLPRSVARSPESASAGKGLPPGAAPRWAGALSQGPPEGPPRKPIQYTDILITFFDFENSWVYLANSGTYLKNSWGYV